jgi:acyl dehydratase
MIEWFDDLELGMRFKGGEVAVTKEDIKRFATEFDPQPMHLDEAAAEKTAFKGLAASGWHTAAMAMRLAEPTVRTASTCGLGVDDLRWMMPLRHAMHIGAKWSTESVADQTARHAKIKWTAYNQRGEAVYTFTPIGIVRVST